MTMAEMLTEALAAAAPKRAEGKVADYIPALARVDPAQARHRFRRQGRRRPRRRRLRRGRSRSSRSPRCSCWRWRWRRSASRSWEKVGREPSGSAFNSIVQLESEKGKPRNPLINPGAMVVTDQLIGGGTADDAVAALLDLLRAQARDPSITVDEEVARSEAATGARNRALAWFMKNFGVLGNDVETVLDAYFRQCAVAMSCRQLARAGLFLAFDGRDPETGVEDLPAAPGAADQQRDDAVRPLRQFAASSPSASACRARAASAAASSPSRRAMARSPPGRRRSTPRGRARRDRRRWRLWSSGQAGRCSSDQSGARNDRAAPHDHPHPAHGGNVAGRIALDRDQIGEQAGPDRAAVGEPEDAGVAGGRGDQHVGGAHAPGGHQLHLARHSRHAAKTPTSPPMQIVTPAASAAAKLARLARDRFGLRRAGRSSRA